MIIASIIRVMTRRNITGDSNLRNRSRGNLKSHFRLVIQDSNLICGRMLNESEEFVPLLILCVRIELTFCI